MSKTPTLISYTDVSYTTVGSPRSSSVVSWNAGDVVAVLAANEGVSTLGNPTATGLTFTIQKSNIVGSTCSTMIAAAQATAAGSSAISVTSSVTTTQWGFSVWVWRQSNGIGASAEQHTTTKTVSVTPSGGTHSAFVWGAFDFSAAATGALVPTATNTRQLAVSSTHYTYGVGDLIDQSSSGATSYGGSGSSTGVFSLVVLEIMGQNGLGNNYQSFKVGDGMSMSEKIR